MKVVFLPNSNRIATNETGPFSCITSYSKEQKYTKKQRTSSHLVQIQAMKIFMITANSLASPAIIGLLYSAMSQNLWRKNGSKLDGVGPIDNRPSTNKLHHFVPPPQKKKLHVTCDT